MIHVTIFDKCPSIRAGLFEAFKQTRRRHVWQCKWWGDWRQYIFAIQMHQVFGSRWIEKNKSKAATTTTKKQRRINIYIWNKQRTLNICRRKLNERPGQTWTTRWNWLNGSSRAAWAPRPYSDISFYLFVYTDRSQPIHFDVSSPASRVRFVELRCNICENMVVEDVAYGFWRSSE